MNQEVEALGSPEELRAMLDEDPSPDLWGRINSQINRVRRDREYKSTWKKANPEKNRASSRKWAKENPEKVRATKRAAYAKTNLERRNEYWREYRKANLEKMREYDRKRRAENREKVRAASRRCYVAHREKNRDKQNSYSKVYAKANPDKFRESTRKRRARKLKAGGTFTTEQFLDLCSSYGNICLCCRRTEDVLLSFGLKLVPDHIVSLSKGGSNAISNIQPLCHGKDGCNNHKLAHLIDWRNLRTLGIILHNLEALSLVGLTRF
jgi:hypothetical protein